MPHLQPLKALQESLQAELDSSHFHHGLEWGNPRAMSVALKEIRRTFGGEGVDVPETDVLLATLLRFAQTLKAATFTELKYVCFGLTVKLPRQDWRFIDQPAMFATVMKLVQEREAQTRQFRRCYQGLLHGYFGFERGPDPFGTPEKHWVRIRDYLAERLDPLIGASSESGNAPEWLRTLSEHRNLLTTDPCRRYANGLSRDDTSELQAVCVGLGISSNSWVWEEALMAYVRLVCTRPDTEFKNRLSSVLDIVNGRSQLKLPGALATQATALIVVRYSHCVDRPEHPDLRDSCVEWIGNPWLKRTAWDAAVNHEPARFMVNSWLKQRLIKDFFELLAADGAADLRRLNYWLKWEPQITDMWFVLGTDAQANRTPEFKEVRKRMAGQDRQLQDPNKANNAFVMRIGPLLVIEFGVTGNACFVFAASEFKADLNKSSFRTNYELKQYGALKKLTHQSLWETKFDYELKKLLQSVPLGKGSLREFQAAPKPGATSVAVQPLLPSAVAPVFASPTAFSPQSSPAISPGTAKPHTPSGLASRSPLPVTPPVPRLPVEDNEPTASAPRSTDRYGRALPRLETSKATVKPRLSPVEFQQLVRLFNKYGVEWEDNRSKGGALWVLVADKNQQPLVTSLMDLYRFRFAEGKGYWLKDEE